MTLPEEDRYVSVAFLAARFDCSAQCIWRWVREGHLPRPVKLGKNTTRWRLSAIKRWEDERREGSRP
jgi:predicted DNA-binding transcriptional regulator AlpA